MTPIQTPPPNIIYIFPDQYRIQALEFWGEKDFKGKSRIMPDPVTTPNLNRLARESVVLNSAVSNCPLSSPHRGMLLTGMYPDGSGVPLNCNSTRPISSLRPNVECISDVLSKAGYNCAYFGKLHLDFPTPNNPQLPNTYVEEGKVVWDAYTPPERRHGFEFWYSYGTFDVHKEPHYWDTEGHRHEIREWSPKHEADKVIHYLRHNAAPTSKQKPFFMMISMNPPHSPYASLDDVEEQDYNLYKNRPIDQLLVRPNADRTRKKANSTAYYFASITGVDREIGRILDELKTLGLDHNTIVIFSSDHGETMCSQHTDDPKNSIFAESLMVPFMVRYPGKLQHRVDNLLLSTPDIMPTLLGLAGHQQLIPSTVQGKNYAPLFFNTKTNTPRPTAALYLRNVDGNKDTNGQVLDYFPIARGIKTERYTLELVLDRKTGIPRVIHFFDDINDPFQLNNLPLNPQSRIGKSLLRELQTLLHQANDPWHRDNTLQHIKGFSL